MKIRFPQETLDKIVDTFTPDVEKIATICIDKDIYEFKTSKPVHVELWADIKEVILSFDNFNISGRGNVSKELAKIMKCKIVSLDTVVCEAVIDGAKGLVDRNTAELIVGKKEDKDLFWVKPEGMKGEI